MPYMDCPPGADLRLERLYRITCPSRTLRQIEEVLQYWIGI